MLFTFDEPSYAGFWMKDMRFPLDLVWIGSDFRVLGVTPMAPCTDTPCPIAYPPAPVALVLEVNLGEFNSANGSSLYWQCSR
jgi:hypothetical protein